VPQIKVQSDTLSARNERNGFISTSRDFAAACGLGEQIQWCLGSFEEHDDYFVLLSRFVDNVFFKRGRTSVRD